MLRSTLALAVFAAVCLPAFAEGDAAADRQSVMSNVGKVTKLGAAMAKEEAPFDAATAEAVFRTLNNAALGFGYMFPEGSQTGSDTEASPKIWEDRAGFDAQVAKFVADTTPVPATLDEFKTAFGTATQNCGACHENWRVKN